MVGAALIVGGVFGSLISKPAVPVPAPNTPISSPIVEDTKPSVGWGLHIDAELHYPGKPDMIAHHYCKVVSGMTECQLYDGDSKDARLVGIETVVDPATYNSFSESEKAMWHYHKTEIPKVKAKLPDMSLEEATKVVKSLEETYGKIYLLWDPSLGNLPVGNPSVTVLK